MPGHSSHVRARGRKARLIISHSRKLFGLYESTDRREHRTIRRRPAWIPSEVRLRRKVALSRGTRPARATLRLRCSARAVVAGDEARAGRVEHRECLRAERRLSVSWASSQRSSRARGPIVETSEDVSGRATHRWKLILRYRPTEGVALNRSIRSGLFSSRRRPQGGTFASKECAHRIRCRRSGGGQRRGARHQAQRRARPAAPRTR